jgi:hypothetical protein
MKTVDGLPRVKGDEREQRGEMSNPTVEAARAEQRAVTGLVKEHEPLNQREAEQELSGQAGQKAEAR